MNLDSVQEYINRQNERATHSPTPALSLQLEVGGPLSILYGSGITHELLFAHKYVSMANFIRMCT